MGRKRAPTSASTVTENGLPWPFIDGQAATFVAIAPLIEAMDIESLIGEDHTARLIWAYVEQAVSYDRRACARLRCNSSRPLRVTEPIASNSRRIVYCLIDEVQNRSLKHLGICSIYSRLCGRSYYAIEKSSRSPSESVPGTLGTLVIVKLHDSNLYGALGHLFDL
jgi:hypothetical protein